jgi:hypothetical protein
MKVFVPKFAIALAATAGITAHAQAEQPQQAGRLLQPEWTAAIDDKSVVEGELFSPPANGRGVEGLNFPEGIVVDREVKAAAQSSYGDSEVESRGYSYGPSQNGDSSEWEFGGWIQHGVTFNSDSPNDRFNGPVITNDRSNEWLMNQLWFYMERQVDIDDCNTNWGGRVDLLYGSDAEFFQMEDGLEESWDQEARFYQFTPLRFYVDYGGNGWLLRAGRFDAPVGYEPFEATETFFYSRSYNFLTQPGTLLGATLTRQLSDEWSATAGLHRGTDQFDDTDGQDSLGFVGGFSYLSYDENSWLDTYMIAQEKGPDFASYHYSVVGGVALTSDVDYVIEWYRGSQEDGDQNEWYGINQQVMRQLNDCWSVGARFEWFRDDDGFAVEGYREGNDADGPFVGNFYELTLAANYTPCDNFALRPELRWDWYDADDNGGPLPFDDQTSSNQFIASIDMILAF